MEPMYLVLAAVSLCCHEPLLLLFVELDNVIETLAFESLLGSALKPGVNFEGHGI